MEKQWPINSWNWNTYILVCWNPRMKLTYIPQSHYFNGCSLESTSGARRDRKGERVKRGGTGKKALPQQQGWAVEELRCKDGQAFLFCAMWSLTFANLCLIPCQPPSRNQKWTDVPTAVLLGRLAPSHKNQSRTRVQSTPKLTEHFIRCKPNTTPRQGGRHKL